ncbi:MAG: hypothetical protein P4L94_07815, partial [Telmatospirillum sp.]|nr:hypothetical protein [Telmatospirillum sp.]
MTRTTVCNATASRRSFRLASLLLGSTAIVGLATMPVAKADETWTGATASNWYATGSWSGGAYPTSADDVFIDTMAIHSTVLQGAGTANDVSVGINGTGSLRVMATGSTLDVQSLELGLNVGSTGTLTVDSGATVTSTAGLTIGTDGTGIVVVQTGGTLNSSGGLYSIVSGANGTGVIIDGAGSSWNAGSLEVGIASGSGSVLVRNGGLLTTGSAELGGLTQPNGVGVITVTGTGSGWNALSVNIGDTGTGTVNIQNNATLNVTADLTVGGTNAYSG